jgi:hypothetical protein
VFTFVEPEGAHVSVIPNFPQNLLDMHHAWHSAGAHPPFPGRSIPPGQPGSGLEFLQFHRNFMVQFHAWYDSQPGADQNAVAAWSSIPPELKVGAVGWNSNLAMQEQRITTANPPFASADELGQYIENGIHNWIHGATASAFNEPAVADFHSPKSTLFYKIHGLVDLWWQQWHAPKTRLKDVFDTDPKRLVLDKVVLREGKQLQKDVIPDGKAQFKEIKEKDKDKDLVENPGDFGEEVINPVINPQVVQLQDISRRLEALEGFVTRPSFIRAAERPDVGAHVLDEGPEG